jgi:RNA polymerase sigma-70 factor (ECF subfamily)
VAHAHADAAARAVAALPPDLRTVFVLHQSEQLGYHAIGEILGLSESTVRGRLARARHALLVQLREWT